MNETMMLMKLTMEAQDKRIAQLGVEIERLKMNENNNRHRNTATMPKPYTIRHTTAPTFRIRDRVMDSAPHFDTSSTVSVTRSVVSSPTAGMSGDSYMSWGPSLRAYSRQRRWYPRRCCTRCRGRSWPWTSRWLWTPPKGVMYAILGGHEDKCGPKQPREVLVLAKEGVAQGLHQVQAQR